MDDGIGVRPIKGYTVEVLADSTFVSEKGSAQAVIASSVHWVWPGSDPIRNSEFVRSSAYLPGVTEDCRQSSRESTQTTKRSGDEGHIILSAMANGFLPDIGELRRICLAS
ncbi:hypothetical protein Bbelb_316880 [Branchiostoma belcheri]|nr:hypothetical protein Bbelb_316880 [Branchiostoma belcheri]